MARKKKKKQNKRTASPQAGRVKNTQGKSVDPASVSLEEAVPLVNELISGERQKAALEIAKAVHDRYRNAESEALLVESYLARIDGLLSKGLSNEAKALVDLVSERFPAYGSRLEPLKLMTQVKSGDLAPLVAPLLDPDLSRERRLAIESLIRSEVTDLGLLAECQTLPPDHPLRLGAARVWEAFKLVCTGPVEDDEIALPEISRRSPLAGWKMLVRALAAFYRHDDQACQKSLEAVPPDSTPAVLIPVLQSVMASRLAPDLQPRARILAKNIGGDSSDLVRAVQEIDRILGTGHRGIMKAVQRAISACKRSNPELLEKLKQHLFIRTYSREEYEPSIIKALGGPPLKDASFWRNMAVAFIYTGNPLMACAAWEEFRLHALHEGLLEPGSMGESILYRYMAGQCTMLHPTEYEYRHEVRYLKEKYKEILRSYKKQPSFIQEAVTKEKRDPDPYYFLKADELFARACASGSPEDTFPQWLAYAKQHEGITAANKIAEKWHMADPQNITPLLNLIESAEKRKAYKKGLALVTKAEKLDELNPVVRRARLRLLMANAKRHITQKKPHLLDKDIMDIQAAPQIREGDRPALVGCLNWAACLLRSDTTGETRFFEEISERFGNPLAAWLLLNALARTCGLEMKTRRPSDRKWTKEGLLIEMVARIAILANEADFDLALPAQMGKSLVSVLSKESVTGTILHFRVLAEMGLRNEDFALAYAASGAGLALGGYSEARFLYLRALSVAPYPSIRKEKCLAAAIHLAKKQGDNTLVEEAMEDLREDRTFIFMMKDDMADIPPAEVAKVIALEKEYRSPDTQAKASTRYRKLFPEEPDRFFPDLPYPPGLDEPEDFIDFLDSIDHDFDDDDPFGFQDEWIEEDESEPLDDLPFQIPLFPKNAAQALLDVMMKMSEKYPVESDAPSPEEIARDDPKLAKELDRALEDYVREYGEEPYPEKVFKRAMGQGRGKKSGKQAKKKKKARKKRK